MWPRRSTTHPATPVGQTATLIGRRVVLRPIATGDFDVRVPTDRRDEMGALAVAFNDMTARLAHLRELESKLHQVEKAAVVGRLLQKAPRRRFPTAAQALRALEAVPEHPPDGEHREHEVGERQDGRGLLAPVGPMMA